MTKFISLNMIGSAAKIFLAAAIMIASIAAFIASINQAKAATLKSTVSITNDNVTLGDVYEDIVDNADFVLAPAPEPGVTLVWDSKTIHRIARAFDLPKPNATDQITIRRFANIITSDMVKKDILISLKNQKIEGQYELEFFNPESARIILPQDIEPDFTITKSSYNPSRKTFSATLQTANNLTRHIKGMMHPMVDVPVLKLSARRGETIGRNDVTTVAMREDFLTDTMVVRADNLVGMTPRKIIRAKTPVAMNDLQKPTLVKRGELVTMQLQRGPIQISSLAKALEAGTQGETIRLLNIDSKRTIEAEIIGLRTARVLF